MGRGKKKIVRIFYKNFFGGKTSKCMDGEGRGKGLQFVKEREKKKQETYCSKRGPNECGINLGA